MPERPSSAVSVRGAARARELTVHAAILAAAVWAFVGADVISPGPLGRYSGFPKGNDFVQFYVAGSLARDGDFGALADAARFRQAQARFLGPGATVSFPPVYGPQVAVFFSAFARLPYLAAYALWAALSLALTLLSVSACRRRVPALAAWPWPVTVAAVAYPPLGYLVLDGQLSALALAACALAVVGLARGSRVAAGAAIGLLGYKVSLFAPAVALCFLAGEWTMVAAAAGVAALQVGLAIPIVGIGGVAGYLHNLLVFARSPDLLTRNPYLMASFRTFWSALLPAPAAAAAYVLSAGGSLAVAAWGWRRAASPVARIGLMALATALASPHLFLYDLVILAPAFVASAGILVIKPATTLRWFAWLAFFAPLTAPLAAITQVQLVTLVLAGWLVALARDAPEASA